MTDSESGSWRDWYRQHASRLLLYARQWLPERADAEDAVQTGFVKFWRNKPNATESDTPLLYTTVRCAALDLLKRNARRVRREDQLALESGDVWWDADTLTHQEIACDIRRAMESLPAAQREVIVLRVWAELSFAEIAATVGESINTITSRYRYALEKLKKIMTEEDYERI